MTLFLKKLLRIFGVSFTLLVISMHSWAVDTVHNDAGLAISGYDPVAYFTKQRPIWGNEKYSYQWQGVTWQFDSTANKNIFIANPKKYAPQYGGYCAYAAAKGAIAPGDPNAWTITNGKLYFNYSPAIKQRWLQNIQGYTARADRKWPKLKEQ